MSAVQDIIAKWPSPAEFGRDLGLTQVNHGHMMKMRMSIGMSHWPTVIEAARKRKIKGITYEALVKAHAADAQLREASRLSREKRASISAGISQVVSPAGA